jgi:hypothetical protein
MSMASEEMDRLIAHLKPLGLAHAARNLDEHLQQAAALKLSGLSLLAPIVISRWGGPRQSCPAASQVARRAPLRLAWNESFVASLAPKA